ncbi:hypothetical protein LUZ60_013424 [Juncus effusus]|nr:hypothetical protein LUZ60_013424 [Juncus effusus]
MAHFFAIGLEARLAGTIDEFYNQIVDTRANQTDMLYAYHIVQIASPFPTAADYFTHFTILNAVGKTSKLHIIHLGIDFGYQWPRLMQALSEKKGTLSPSLRITGIDVPEIEQIEEVGRRLIAYARSFGIPFEYKAIQAKLEEVCVEDVNIEKDELVIVICFHRMETLGEEMDLMNSPKNRVLDIIRRINPNIFIQGITNISFSGALFPPRFKQAIQHYSALFDFFDTNVPRDNKARKLIENFVWAREAINVIACEGPKRTQRCETYKQWNARNLRAGFEQLPLDHFVITKIKEMGNNHNKSFFVEGDNEWLLLGWKGRTIKAISTWRPKQL